MVLSYLRHWVQTELVQKGRWCRCGEGFLAVTGLLALTDTLPPLPTGSAKPLGALLLSLFLLRRFRERFSPLSSFLLTGIGLCTALFVPGGAFGAAFALSLAAFWVPSLRLWAQVSIAWAAIAFICRNNPFFWDALDGFAIDLSRWVTRNFGFPLGLSPLTLGWNALLLGALLTIAATGRKRASGGIWLFRAGSLLLWWVFCAVTFWGLTAFVAFWTSWKGLAPTKFWNALTLHPILTTLMLLVPCWWASDEGSADEPLTQPIRAFLKGQAIFIVSTTLALFSSGWIPLPPKPKPICVALLEPLMGDWSVPKDGRYGVGSWGMYGMLPRYLRALGFRVKRIGRVTEKTLQGSDVLFLITPMRMPTEREVHQVERFVYRGGGLAVFSDHTDLEGIMGRLNKWLDPFGVQIPFDSAIYLWWDEVPCFELRPHPITVGIDPTEIRIAIGSSVRLRPPLRPIVLFRFGFSDEGNYRNKEKAFMGNEIPDPDERIGDIVLVGAGRWGRGKVVVFGDTSGLQNPSLPESWRFIARTVNWLGGRDDPVTVFRESFWGGTAVFVAAALTLLPSVHPFTCLLGSSIGVVTNKATQFLVTRRRQGRWHRVKNAIAIDRCHANAFPLRRVSDSAITGFYINLMRRGFLPFLTLEGETKGPLKRLPRWSVIIEPKRPLSSGTVKGLRAWLRRGGKLLVFIGRDGFRNLRPLLAPYGLTVKAVPLGRGEGETVFPIRIGGREVFPTLLDAWSLRYDGTGWRTIAWRYGMPVIAARKIGKGTLCVVADPRWVQDWSLETYDRPNLPNVVFLRALLEAIRRDDEGSAKG